MPKTKSDFRTRYCVFWIPCITHNEPKSIVGTITDCYESSDRQWTYEVRSSISISHGDLPVKVTISLHIKETSKGKPSDNCEYDVELRSVEYSRNGLICFEYSLPKSEDAKFNEPLRNKIYSQIKGHFHTHLYHPKYGGLKKGYYSENRTRCTIRKYDGEVLRFYLHQIADMVSEEADFLLDESKELKFDYKPNNDSEAAAFRKSLGAFLGRCQNLLGQFTFYSSLLNSKWNRSCTLQPIQKTGRTKEANDSRMPDEDLHELAHNIYNTKESLDRLNTKVQSAFYLNNIHRHSDLQTEIVNLADEIKKIASDNNGLANAINKSNKLSSFLGWLSLGITIVLGSISIWQGCSDKSLSKDEINNISTQLNRQMADSIRQENKIQHQ